MTFDEYCSKYHIRLSDQQREAVLTPQGEVLLLAVPGSGKTTVIVARTGWLILGCDVNPKEILTITYSKAAAIEMEERFKAKFRNDIAIPKFSTIHSLCVSVLHKVRQMRGIAIPTLEPDMNRLIRTSLYQSTQIWASDFVVKRLALLITFVKNKMYSEEEIATIQCSDLANEYNGLTFQEFYHLYETYKQKNNLMDFDDQLLLCYNYLLDFDDVRHYFQSTYPYISVDESQDTSLVQYEIIRILANGGKSLFLVGDDDQSIYGFRGAEPANILNFTASFPDAKVLYMETNYRSCKTIVEAADSFINKNVTRFKKNAKSFDTTDGTINIITKETELGVYNYILRKIKDIQGTDKTMAVLSRNNFSLLPLVHKLNAENIPVKKRDNFESFFNHPTILHITSLLALAKHPWDIDAFRIAKTPMKLYITNTQMNEIAKRFEGSPLVLEERNVLEIAKEVCCSELHIMEAIKKAQKIFSIIALQCPNIAIKTVLKKFQSGISGAEDYEYSSNLNTVSIYIGTLLFLAQDYKDIDSFLDMIQFYSSVKSGTHVNSNITLSTMHSAKGLEFDTVIILDALDGILPQEDADQGIMLDIEEDSRLFYVAVTRAKHEVEFVLPQNLYGINVKPSKFIKRLQNQQIEETEENPNKNSTFKKGMRVHHSSFGEGVITAIKDDILTVRFDKSGVKRILDTFCKPL